MTPRIPEKVLTWLVDWSTRRQLALTGIQRRPLQSQAA
jgi:hypothetical protein